MTTTTTTPAAGRRLPGLLRLAITLQTVAVFAQAITAGLLLTSPAGGAAHSAGSYTLFSVTLAHLVIAVLAWRPGGGPVRPVLHAAGFFGLTLAQVALGLAHVKSVHVPLGVALFGLSLLHLVTVSPRRNP
ncbi:hypothetical protein [Bailinhaonella thermotolerans]|uniref:Integral membrane protein n=1 Tax=Bailinhaonella thermotolerans TaxID=1070861 RepID=A0A3A4A9P5_9ACTN|nr:hypothetical protein [Bailinhaonella thermotolerans]RJL23044.1 hypothetical protein D5H75_34290 [Bailinhaonella thermotolerans]